ncbi:sigma-70 family RNA polymerase sigma factor [Demequina sediminicola]|uniref:sigma-70 family RNA polymerase sigma factor n=1 Tax=Demequina sediminicola TaxID=1095026 RepID=UPI0009E3AEB1|nr:sigma-70 family RNA polymerase sigma factor [Demequina sediminicola]
MSSEAIAIWTETSSDPELIAGVRAGDPGAFGVLYERHVDAARKVATQYTNSPSDVDDVVSESFSRILRALQRGDGPDLAFRAYLFTIVRRTGMDIINKGIRTKPRDDMSPYEAALGHEASSDEPALAGFEQSMVADAFRSLPERWQAVLWYTEVEKKSPKEIAPLLGLSANGTAALAYRAREALRQAYLQEHLNTSDEIGCMEANSQLGTYVRGGLSKREHQRVDDHVNQCARCAALVVELQDVNRGMRAVIAPLMLGTIGMGALQGGLPIGGAWGPGGAAAGSGSAATAGGGVAATTGTGVLNSFGAAGIMGTLTQLALPTAAVVGAGALVFGGVQLLGSNGDVSNDSALTDGEPDKIVHVLGDDEFPADGNGDSASTDAGTDTASDASTDADENDAASDAIGNDTSPGGATGPGSTQGGSAYVPGFGTHSGANTNSGAGTNSGSGIVPNSEPDGATGGSGTGSDSSTPGDNSETPDTGTSTGPDPAPQPDPDPDPTTDPTADPAPVPRDALRISRSSLDFLEIPRDAPSIAMELSNISSVSVDDVTASIKLPDGLTFGLGGGGGGNVAGDSVALQRSVSAATAATFAVGDWDCTLSTDSQTALCTSPQVAAGTTTSLDFPIGITADELAADAATLFTVNAGDVSDTYSLRTGLRTTDDDLDDGFEDQGGLAVSHFGAPLMGCEPETDRCDETMGSSTHPNSVLAIDNNAVAMVPLRDLDDQRNGGTTTVELPEGAVVTHAILEWSANRHAPGTGNSSRYGDDSWDGALDSALLRVPGGDFAQVEGVEVELINQGGREYYRSRADVTALVEAAGDGDYSLADVAQAASQLDDVPTYYSGFALTIVYEDPAVPATTAVKLLEGPHWVSTSAPVQRALETQNAADVTVSWTAFETDYGNRGDSVKVDRTALTPLRGDSLGSSNNAGDSFANGSVFANSLGTDAKSFSPIHVEAGSHTVTVATSGDNFFVGTLAITIAPESTEAP